MRHRTFLPLLSVITAITASGCGTAADKSPSAAAPAISVAVTSVRMADRPEIFEAGGALRGRAAAVVSSRVMATVRAVSVLPGARVRAGQLLVQLDDAGAAASARQAEAAGAAAAHGLDRARAEARAADTAAALARASHARISALHERRSSTAQEFDDARAALDGAESRATAAAAAVAAAEAVLAQSKAGGEGAGVIAGYARLVAPFDGVITARLVDPGTLVSPGTPLVSIEDVSAFELEVRVDESRAAWVRPGATVPVALDTPAGALIQQGRVVDVERAVDIDARSVLVTIALDAAEGMAPGMFGRARLPGPVARALMVPESSVVRRGQLTSVFVVEGNTARMRLVRPGSGDGQQLEITAGLSEGESIVLKPSPALRDGASVVATGVTP